MYRWNRFYKIIFFVVVSLFSASIRVVSAANPEPQDPALLQFRCDLSPHWNLVSLPLVPFDASVASLFPDAISAFSFNGSYFPVSELSPCKAYWINLAEGGSYTVQGTAIVSTCTDAVNSGWNLFGAPRGVTQVAEIYQEPDDILISVFGFDKGYYLADTMNEGVGYWVNLSTDGIIALTGLDGSVINIPTNAPPVATDQSVTTDQNAPLTIFLDGYDPDGNFLTFSLTQGPANGTATLSDNTVFTPPQKDSVDLTI